MSVGSLISGGEWLCLAWYFVILKGILDSSVVTFALQPFL